MKQNNFKCENDDITAKINSYRQINLAELATNSQENNQINDLIKKINFTKPFLNIFVIDLQKYEEIQLYIICFDDLIIIIDEHNLWQIKKFIELIINISKNQDSLYFITPNIKDNFLSAAKINTQENLIKDDDPNHKFFKEEIHNFNAAIKIEIENNINEWRLIYRALLGCIIKKSYYRTKCLRKTSSKKFKIQPNFLLQKYKETDFINMRIINRNDGTPEGTSNVFLSYYIPQDEIVAIKKFRFENCYVKELKYIESLRYTHYYQVKYLGTIEYADKSKGIVLVFIQGITLSKSISKFKRNFTLNEKLQFLLEIMISIENIHLNGFVYRDLKPDNIIIDENNKAILTDFDQSKEFDFDSNENEISNDIGSLFYISYEQYTNNICSFASDVYSIGQIMYFLITNKDPLINHSAPIEFPEDCQFLIPIYEKCTLKDHSKRPSILSLFDILYRAINEQNLNNSEIEKLFYFSTKIFGRYYKLEVSSTLDYLNFYLDKNDPSALYWIAHAYGSGIYYERDLDKAIYYFELSAKQNDVKSLMQLASIYYADESTKQDINKAIYYYTLSANLNDSEAQRFLGIIYSEGKDAPIDMRKAIHYLKLSADQNNKEAQYLLGVKYLKGNPIQQDIEKAFHYLSLSANQSNDKAQFLLGHHYCIGQYVRRDVDKGIKYFELSAIQNNSEAQLALGSIYINNVFVPRDLSKALYYLNLSAEQNNQKAKMLIDVIRKTLLTNPDSYQDLDTKSSSADYIENLNFVASYYYDGKVVERDINKAIYYYKLASEKNDSYAQYMLGKIYFKGEYVEKNDIKAIKYLTLSALQNNPKAQYLLGIVFYSNKSDQKDLDKAIHYFTLSADQNHSEAQFILGFIFYHGGHVKIDLNKSLHYLTLSANQNNPQACNLLGCIYYENATNREDINKALNYFTLAANQNESDAQFNLGIIPLTCKFVEKDVNKTIYYLTLAANQNHSNAQFYLGVLYYSNIYVKQDIKKSINYFILSANQNNSYSQMYLAKFYLEGIYVKKDIDKALYYYKLSANENNSDAQLGLGIIYFYDEYGRKDINKAIHYFNLAANQKNSEAEIYLAFIYLFGHYVPKDENKAIYYLSLPENKDDPKAQILLGMIYSKKNINKSIEYLTLAAEKLVSEANLFLGYIFYKGEYIKKDIQKAIHYFSISANQNNKYAQHYLGIIYLFDEDIPQNIEKAIEYLTISANQNDRDSQFILACIYFQNEYVPRDINKAIFNFTRAADNGISYSCYLLGEIYYHGEYIAHDIDKAIHYFKKSSNLRDVRAKNYLGVIYKNGNGVKKNIYRAIEYFKEGIDYPNSCYNLARIYYFGIDSIDKDIDKSIELLEKASSHNLIEADVFLFFIFSYGYPQLKSHPKVKYNGNFINDQFRNVIDNFARKENFTEKIFNFFKEYDLLISDSSFLYQSIIYYLEHGIILHLKDDKKEEKKLKDINEIFYEGLGISSLIPNSQ